MCHCKNWCRDWRETLGGKYPRSEHAPPVPIEPEDEVARLQREYIEATKALMEMASKIEAIQPSIRRAA